MGFTGALRGNNFYVRFNKIVNRRIRQEGKNVNLAADVNAVVSANVAEKNSHSKVSTRQRIVQRSSRGNTEGGSDGREG